MLTVADLRVQSLSAPKFWVYLLADPRNGEIRYIGQTRHIHKRYHRSLSDESRAKTEWINELRLAGLQPRKMLLESALTKEVAETAENYWIQYCLAHGANLLNVKRRQRV